MVRASMVPMLLVCCGLAAQTPDAGQATRLSLRDALQTSLKNNLQVDIAQQAREVTRAGIQINQGPFDWNLNANASLARLDTASTAPANRFAKASTESLTTSYPRSLSVDMNKNFIWGGNLDLNYAPTYGAYQTLVINGVVDANGNPIGNYTTNNPVPYTGSFTATYTQSLMQGFGTDVTTAPLVIARKNSESADYTFQQAIINLVSTTETQYWAVVYAQRNLANYQIALELAQKLLNENKIKLQVGTMAPLDVTAAEAQVAQAEQNIISGQAALDNAKDALIRALYPNAERPASLELTDTPNLGYTHMDEATAVKMALDRRVELKAARISKDVNQLQMTVAQDKVRPQLNAFVAYNGSADTYSSLGSVNSDLAGVKYPGYTVGLKFAMPIQNNAAKGNLSVARANLRSSELNLRDQQLSITLQVRTAIRNVEATEKGVKAAEKTRYFQE